MYCLERSQKHALTASSALDTYFVPLRSVLFGMSDVLLTQESCHNCKHYCFHMLPSRCVQSTTLVRTCRFCLLFDVL